MRIAPSRRITSPFIIGFSFIWLFFVIIGGFLAGAHASSIFFFLAYAVFIFLCYKILKKKSNITTESVVACGFGAYISQGLFSMTYSPFPIVIATEVVLLAILVTVLLKTRTNLTRSQE